MNGEIHTAQRMVGPGDDNAFRRVLQNVGSSAMATVGAGKTVAVRAATAGLDPSRHSVIYM